MIQRIKDWRLERRIKRLSREFMLAYEVGDKDRARAAWALKAEAIGERSPAQVRRMERKMGIA